MASLSAGFISSAASLPLDTVKTRLQTMKEGQYKGPVDCAMTLLKNEGVFGFWKGFLPYFLRVGPHTILTFVFLEQMSIMYGRLIQHKEYGHRPAWI